MTADGATHERGMGVRKEVLGDEHVDAAMERTTPFTADFQDLISSDTGVGGDDTIDVSDGDAGDSVDCGPGTDTVYVDTQAADGQVNDAIDSYVNCERVREGDAPSSP